MTPLQVWHTVMQAGGRLTPHGNNLIVEAPAPLPADVMILVRQYKPTLLALLRQDPPALLSDIPVNTSACQPVTVSEGQPMVQAHNSPRAPSAQPHDSVWRCRHCSAVVPIARLHWGYCDAPACDSARQEYTHASWPWLQRESRAAGGEDRA
jgi:hypothetical protein